MVLQLGITVRQEAEVPVTEPDAVLHHMVDVAEQELLHLSKVKAFVIRFSDEIKSYEAVQVALKLSDHSVRLLFDATAISDHSGRHKDAMLAEEVLLILALLKLCVELAIFPQSHEDLHQVLVRLVH